MYKYLAASVFLVFSAGVASACPDYSQSGKTAELSAKDLLEGMTYEVKAGGNVDLQACEDVRPVLGDDKAFVTEAPDYTYDLSSMSGYKLEISLESECNGLLLVNTASAAWHYAAATDGKAEVALNEPEDGWLDIWIGTEEGDLCDSTLSVKTANR